jgi:uncharacterized protein (DUF58 family)
VITRRGYLALGATGLALLVAAFALELLLLLAAVAAFGLVAGEILLFHLSPAPPDDWKGSRGETPVVLSPGARAATEVEVEYRGPAAQLASFTDLLPYALIAAPPGQTPPRWWRTGDRAVLRSELRASARGSHVVGPLAITLLSPRRLAWEQRFLPETRSTLKVIPPAPIERVQRIGFSLYTRVQGRLALRRRGFGTEFRSLRPYEPDDDLRHVAWRRSRPGQWYVREFEQESRQDFLLLLDVTPSMLVGLPGQNALDRAVEAASLVTAFVARSGEDRVGLATATNEIRQYLRPSRGARHFRILTENLAYLRTVNGQFALAPALNELTRRLPKNTHVLLFSPLREPLQELHVAYARFRHRGHRLYAFVPQAGAFYPDPSPRAPGLRVLEWAREEEGRRTAALLSDLRGEGVPVFPYDRRGASGRVVETYAQLRAWGIA